MDGPIGSPECIKQSLTGDGWEVDVLLLQSYVTNYFAFLECLPVVMLLILVPSRALSLTPLIT